MQIGVLAFLTEQSGEPGMLAQEAERLGLESFWVAEHLIIPPPSTTYYPHSPDGKIPEFSAHLIDPFVARAAAQAAFSNGVAAIKQRAPLVERAQHVSASALMREERRS